MNKVNRISPNDPRTQNMDLGSYGYTLTATMMGDIMEGTKNKYFWQCAKCEYIHKNKISATQCFDMHSQLIKLQTNNPNRQIGNRVTYTTTGRFPNRYEAIITNIVNKNTIEVCPVKRIDLK